MPVKRLQFTDRDLISCGKQYWFMKRISKGVYKRSITDASCIIVAIKNRSSGPGGYESLLWVYYYFSAGQDCDAR